MDPLEKKIRELYRQKKREDEQSIPAFDSLFDKPEQEKRVRHSYFLLKLAASVFLVVGAGSYYFLGYRRAVTAAVKIYPDNIYQHLPTQSLLNSNAGAVYMWNWKAPTDQLLNDAAKSLKTQIKI